jgi:hypothetical protein
MSRALVRWIWHGQFLRQLFTNLILDKGIPLYRQPRSLWKITVKHNISIYCKIFQFLSTFTKFRKAIISYVTSIYLSVLPSDCPSVRPSACNNCAPTTRIFVKFDICFFNSVEKIKDSLKFDKNNGYFIWRPVYIYDDISLNYFWMRKVSDKSCREYQNTYFMSKNFVSKIVPFMR